MGLRLARRRASGFRKHAVEHFSLIPAERRIQHPFVQKLVQAGREELSA